MSIVRRLLGIGALALAILVGDQRSTQAAGVCQAFYDATVPVPTGWAAAYDLFHAAHQPLATVNCTLATTPLSVGLPNDPTVYVFQTAYLYPSDAGVAGSGVTNGVTVPGSTTLHFASTPGSVVAGQAVTDATAPSALQDGTTVVSVTGTTVEITPAVPTNSGHGSLARGVLSGDTIMFSPAWRAVALSASQPPTTGGWLVVPAMAPLNLTSGELNADWNYLAFLTARWNGTKWLVGCADAVCASSNWSLQAITRQITLTATITPVSPNIADDTALGSTVATVQCVWSDASPCTATFSIVDPSSIYKLSGSNIIVDPAGPGVGVSGSSDTVSVTATQ